VGDRVRSCSVVSCKRERKCDEERKKRGRTRRGEEQITLVTFVSIVFW
jgi:hypothetical protein